MTKKCQSSFKDDTIAAIATAAGSGGIGIVRISGLTAFKVAEDIFELNQPNQSKRSYIRLTEDKEDEETHFEAFLEPKRLYFGRLHDAVETIDYGFIVLFKAPLSYTGEDVVELHSHGGVVIMQAVLEAAISAGARLAEPGEFTKRAYLNGKIDLTQAEAVGELINAKTTLSMKAARARLEGALSARVEIIKNAIFDLTVSLEAELDFSEDEVNDIVSSDDKDETDFTTAIEAISADLKELISTYNEGRNLRDGLTTAILGRPNSGKSSLLNLLLREERAIVASEAGTTRDTIEELISIKGLPIRLIDTAGLRESTDKIETIGIERARKSFDKASLVLFVIDSSKEDIKEDIKELEGLLKSSELNNTDKKDILIIFNKSDLSEAKKFKALTKELGADYKTITVSALKGTGLGSLEGEIFSIGAGTGGEAASITTLRQLSALTSAKDAIERVRKAFKDGVTKDALAVDLHIALDHIADLMGDVITDDVILNKIFSSFCIGK